MFCCRKTSFLQWFAMFLLFVSWFFVKKLDCSLIFHGISCFFSKFHIQTLYFIDSSFVFSCVFVEKLMISVIFYCFLCFSMFFCWKTWFFVEFLSKFMFFRHFHKQKSKFYWLVIGIFSQPAQLARKKVKPQSRFPRSGTSFTEAGEWWGASSSSSSSLSSSLFLSLVLSMLSSASSSS